MNIGDSRVSLSVTPTTIPPYIVFVDLEMSSLIATVRTSMPAHLLSPSTHDMLSRISSGNQICQPTRSMEDPCCRRLLAEVTRLGTQTVRYSGGECHPYAVSSYRRISGPSF